MVDYFLHESRRGCSAPRCHGHDGPQPRHSGPSDRGLRAGERVEDGVFGVTEERPRLGRALLPWLWLADLRVHEVHQPQVRPGERRPERGDPGARQPGGGFPGPVPAGLRLADQAPGHGADRQLRPDSRRVPGGEESPTEEARETNGWIFLVLIGLAALYGAWRWFSARRRFRFMSPGDRGWARLNLAAQRAGIGRQPSETFYEYAGWLEAELPSRADEIRTIADGKVWSSYSRSDESAGHRGDREGVGPVAPPADERLRSGGGYRPSSDGRSDRLGRHACAGGCLVGRPSTLARRRAIRRPADLDQGFGHDRQRGVDLGPRHVAHVAYAQDLPGPLSTAAGRTRPRWRIAVPKLAHSSPLGSQAAVTVAERSGGRNEGQAERLEAGARAGCQRRVARPGRLRPSASRAATPRRNP